MACSCVAALANATELNSIALSFANVKGRASGGKTMMKIMYNLKT